MLTIMFAMVPAVLVAAVVMAYVAYPYRGQRLPFLPGLGEALHRRVEALPTLEGQAEEDARTSERPRSLLS